MCHARVSLAHEPQGAHNDSMRKTSPLRACGTIFAALLAAHCGSSDTAPAAADDVGSDTGQDAIVNTDSSTDSAVDSGGAGDVADVSTDTAEAPPADPCAGRLVCDDFEKSITGAKPDKPWNVMTSKGTALIDETRAYSGKRSVKVSIDATTSTDTYRRAMLAITGAPLIPLTDDTVYGRFMIWTDRIPDKSVHWTFAHGDGPLGTLSATYNYGGMGGLMANYYKNSSPSPTDCWQTKTQTFPTSKWSCVAFKFDGKNAEMRFWLDGTEIPELHVVGMTKTDATCTVKGVDGRWLAPEFKNISVGWESYQHDVAGAHTAWIDDVILDSKAIPCP